MKLASLTVAPEAATHMTALLRQQVLNLVSEHGLEAFEMPRSAALAHEVGHAVVSTHDGARVRGVRVWPIVATGGKAWCGFCDIAGPRVRYDHQTPRRTYLGKICNLLAGVLAEEILAPEDARKGSSLDEIIASQHLAAMLANQLGVDAESLWQVCWHRTAAVIRHNADLAGELIAKLDKTETIRGKPLASSLAKVRGVSGARLDDLIVEK